MEITLNPVQTQTNQSQIVLTEKQVAAVNAITAFIGSEALFFSLIGYAGTGKTTVINHIVAAYKKGRITVTAPTNKAVNVIREMQAKTGLHFETMTIHQYLGVKQILKYDEAGNAMSQVFEAVYGHQARPQNEIVIVDEASMVDERLYKMIARQADFSRTKFIFIGDDAQLPPIGEKETKCFSAGESIKLDEIVRTSSENPIINYLTTIRNDLMATQPQFSRTNRGNESGGIYFYDIKTQFHRAIKTAFKKAQEDGTVRNLKCLAWTKSRVKNINNYVRATLYPEAAAGDEIQELVIGELMTALAPVKIEFDGKMITAIQNSEDFVVKAFHKKEFDDGKYTGYNITAYILSDGRTEYINMLDEESKKKHKKYVKLLKDTAIVDKSKELWRKHYAEKERFADISYAYATTVHKSQGSTFTEVFIHEQDIDLNQRVKERNQCRYVAYSRASRCVHVYNI